MVSFDRNRKYDSDREKSSLPFKKITLVLPLSLTQEPFRESLAMLHY